MTSEPPIRIRFLGTNGWYDSVTGATICTAVETEQFGVVLDAGNGLAFLDAHSRLDTPFTLLLSHLHLDHVVGLHTLAKLRFAHGLDIVTPPQQAAILERLLAEPFTIPIARLGYPVRVMEVDEAASEMPFTLESLPLEHPVPTVGYRLGIGGRTLAYLCDTAFCDNAVELARGADLVIAECAFRPGETVSLWPHLNPELAAEVAAAADASELVLTHFDASRYTSPAHREEACHVARQTFPSTRAAHDGLLIELG